MQNNQPADLTLYIVEDDRDARKSLATLFAALGYRVQAFATGEDQLDTLERGDVAVGLDLGSGGDEAAKAAELNLSPHASLRASGPGDERVAALARRRDGAAIADLTDGPGGGAQPVGGRRMFGRRTV